MKKKEKKKNLEQEKKLKKFRTRNKVQETRKII
jgi:hypothetical protein